MVYLLLANGFEEVEAFTPVDLLRRCGAKVTTIGIGGKEIIGARDIKVIADITDAQAELQDMDLLILPGGYPGYENLEKSDFVQQAIEMAVEKNIPVAAICAAPTLLGHKGLLKGKRATCYPGMEEGLVDAIVTTDAVCVDGNFITSRSAATALEFSLVLVEQYCGTEAKNRLMQQIVCEG